MHSARLIMYHKQATSARTRFLALAYGGVCAFEGLPDLAEATETEGGTAEKVVPHPGALTGEVERRMGLPAGSLEPDSGFRAKIDAPDGPLHVFLARFTDIDPPFAWAEAAGARFIDLTQARGLPPVELDLLRRAYEQILG